MGRIKEFYNSNKKTCNIIAILSLCLIVIGYFSVFLQMGIYFKETFYKESIKGDSYVYKSSKDNYFTVNKNDDIYTFEIKTIEDYGSIKIKETDGIYHLYYPDNEVYKGEYRNGHFFGEDGSIDINDYITNKNMENKPFCEKYPKGFIIRTVLRDDIEFRGHLAGLLIAIASLFIGVLGLKYPEEMVFWGSRWKFKNYEEVELSEEYIFLNRMASIIALIVSFIAFVLSVK
ncbi:hypothetical protein [uncultured Clostridium sp.]|uniref:hypothetical protein n=1 Tax=uncultured Clostridium sp. TaxID=59620 RepID=UPI0028EB7487|nr:hypothetical protein [uncultured Clostridium sp.]